MSVSEQAALQITIPTPGTSPEFTHDSCVNIGQIVAVLVDDNLPCVLVRSVLTEGRTWPHTEP